MASAGPSSQGGANASASARASVSANFIGYSPNQATTDDDASGYNQPPTGSTAQKTSANRVAAAGKGRSAIACRFFQSRKGCRDGDACPYVHDASAGPRQGPVPQPLSQRASPSQGQAREARPVFPRPIPSLQRNNPRPFEISQLQKRFTPSTQITENATTLTLNLIPSDPDFPFELAGLKCSLTVPNAYPKDARPSLRVANAEMERGYQINIERGFDNLVSQFPSRTLLDYLNELDKKLESLLTSEKAQTIKLVPNVARKAPKAQPEPVRMLSQPNKPVVKNIIPEANFSPEEKAEAKAKCAAELHQLEARLGRDPLYSKLSSNTTDRRFMIPLYTKPSNLPPALALTKTVRLDVPDIYPLLPCVVHFDECPSWEARSVEKEFERHVVENQQMSLMAHVNFLAQNIQKMVHRGKKSLSSVGDAETLVPPPDAVSEASEKNISEEHTTQQEQDGRPHVIMILRPPEWDAQLTASNDDNSEFSDSEDYETDPDDDDDDVDGEEEGGARVPESAHITAPEQGIMLSFPQLEMHGIELLELVSLSLTLKCDRCKETLDINNIVPAPSTSSAPKQAFCKKCASTLTATYRAGPLHANSIRAGYLDLQGCSVVDMLPSAFHPTCAACSTVYTATPVVSVRGDTSLAVCRHCHAKMSFSLPEVKFLRVSNDAATNRLALPLKKKPKENLGIVAGTELPNKGRCKHYAKSYRWFRFGCCGRIYACDKCHDEKEQHPNEHAGRMVCGWCSREQVYRPQECGVCGKSVVGRKGGGFWEGGKGTRDKVRMSRKDGRKYKRRGGGRGEVGGLREGR